MSLDERLRDGLRQSADRGGLDADALFDDVQLARSRLLLRARVVREATAAAVALTLFVGVAMFVSWRTMPARYRSTATVAVAQSSPAIALVKPADPRRVAMSASVRGKALLASHLPADGSRIDFRATAVRAGVLLLAVTADSRNAADAVTHTWVSALASQRRADARQQIADNQRALSDRVKVLHRELQRVDAELAKIDPVVYRGLLEFDAPHGNLIRPNPPPPVPERGSVRELNLAFERIQLLNELTQIVQQADSLRLVPLAPQVSTKVVSRAPATRVDRTPPATGPALAAWLGGLVLLAVGALVIYRLRSSALPRP